MIPNTIALEEYLQPFADELHDNAVSEILLNRPQSVYVERDGLFEHKEIKTLDQRHLMGLANLIARYSDQRLSEKDPLLSGILPSGHRIQLILPPATASDRIVMSIRKQTIANISLDDYVRMGAFSDTKASAFVTPYSRHHTDSYLRDIFTTGNYANFLKEAIKLKKNIIISGATSTGKTTFLNACLKAIPAYEHIVTLEDVAEVKPPHCMHTPLFTSKGLQGVANVTMQDLVQASLRIRPDRIIMGELRGAEANDFINATATGHDGSLSSIHAANPDMTFMRLVHMVKLSGTTLSREAILEDLHTVIDIVVQLKRRIENDKTIREISEIYFSEAHL